MQDALTKKKLHIPIRSAFPILTMLTCSNSKDTLCSLGSPPPINGIFNSLQTPFGIYYDSGAALRSVKPNVRRNNWSSSVTATSLTFTSGRPDHKTALNAMDAERTIKERKNSCTPQRNQSILFIHSLTHSLTANASTQAGGIEGHFFPPLLTCKFTRKSFK